MGKQSYSVQKFGTLDAHLKSPVSGRALREASARFQQQSPRLPIASRIRVASRLISHQTVRPSRTAFRGCVVFHMSRAVWQIELGDGDWGPFKGARLDFELLPESRLGNPMNHSNIPLLGEAYAAYSGRAVIHASLPERARFLGHSKVDGLIAVKAAERLCPH